MDKEKEIEDIGKMFCGYQDRKCKLCCTYLYGQCVETCPYLKFAEKFCNAGYGNVKQAIKEFAEEFYKRCNEQLKPLLCEYGEGANDVLHIFTEFFNEFCSEE